MTGKVLMQEHVRCMVVVAQTSRMPQYRTMLHAQGELVGWLFASRGWFGSCLGIIIAAVPPPRQGQLDSVYACVCVLNIPASSFIHNASVGLHSTAAV